MRVPLLLAALLALLLGAATARAHDVRPAYLELVETRAGPLRVTLRQPVLDGSARAFAPLLSGHALPAAAQEQEFGPDFVLRRWTVPKPHRPLAATTLRVARLEGTLTEILVRAVDRDGRVFETILRADRPSTRLTFGPRAAAVPAYFALGVEHILSGVDHLAFVLGLVLLVGINRRLVWAITAFTVAHSLTLAASVLGVVRAPVATVEALVALSIVFVAHELARGGRQETLASRAPWLIALAFGLLHGFAFAGALAEIGLPERSIPLALLLFNLGVETGQLLFVGAILLALLAARRAWSHVPERSEIQIRRTLAYGLGCFAAFLFIERTASAFA